MGDQNAHLLSHGKLKRVYKNRKVRVVDDEERVAASKAPRERIHDTVSGFSDRVYRVYESQRVSADRIKNPNVVIPQTLSNIQYNLSHPPGPLTVNPVKVSQQNFAMVMASEKPEYAAIKKLIADGHEVSFEPYAKRVHGKVRPPGWIYSVDRVPFCDITSKVWDSYGVSQLFYKPRPVHVTCIPRPVGVEQPARARRHAKRAAEREGKNIHQVVSSLSGSHGEWTQSDDVDGVKPTGDRKWRSKPNSAYRPVNSVCKCGKSFTVSQGEQRHLEDSFKGAYVCPTTCKKCRKDRKRMVAKPSETAEVAVVPCLEEGESVPATEGCSEPVVDSSVALCGVGGGVIPTGENADPPVGSQDDGSVDSDDVTVTNGSEVVPIMSTTAPSISEGSTGGSLDLDMSRSTVSTVTNMDTVTTVSAKSVGIRGPSRRARHVLARQNTPRVPQVGEVAIDVDAPAGDLEVRHTTIAIYDETYHRRRCFMFGTSFDRLLLIILGFAVLLFSVSGAVVSFFTLYNKLLGDYTWMALIVESIAIACGVVSGCLLLYFRLYYFCLWREPHIHRIDGTPFGGTYLDRKFVPFGVYGWFIPVAYSLRGFKFNGHVEADVYVEVVEKLYSEYGGLAINDTALRMLSAVAHQRWGGRVGNVRTLDDSVVSAYQQICIRNVKFSQSTGYTANAMRVLTPEYV